MRCTHVIPLMLLVYAMCMLNNLLDSLLGLRVYYIPISYLRVWVRCSAHRKLTLVIKILIQVIYRYTIIIEL